MWVKGTFLLVFALFIDGLQALIGLGVSTIAMFPGTIGGGVAGCVLSTQIVAGKLSCAVGSFVLGALGSLPFINAPLAAATIPLGIVLVFVINICISITMGTGLIAVLWLCGMFYPGSVTGVFIGEAMPGLDVIPGWTFLVVRSIMKKNAEGGVGIAGIASKLASGALNPASASGIGNLTKGIANMKAKTGNIAQRSPLVQQVYNSEPVENIKNQRTQLAYDVGREITPHAKTA